MSTTISIKELTSIGPAEHTKPLTEAIDFLKQKTSQNAMWLFVDGNETNADTVTADQLAAAQTIVLTNKLLGG